MDDGKGLKLARLLLNRLERLSADSTWAHKASGLRGSLFHIIEEYDLGPNFDDTDKLNFLLNEGYSILELALINRKENVGTQSRKWYLHSTTR